MADAMWKAEERTVANLFGTKRQLMKGTDTKEDIISDLFMVDVKLRRRWNVQQWYRELRESAGEKSKIPILTVREPGKKLRLAVLDLDYLVSILKGAKVLGDNGSSSDDRK